jgi:hypothetical protein
VQRERVAMRRGAPSRVESNIEPLYLDLGKMKLFFLPDQVLYWQRGTFASLDYADLKMTSGATRFIEESVQTSDSQQVGTTWRYVRKDGGPDRRFTNNRKLPICCTAFCMPLPLLVSILFFTRAYLTRHLRSKRCFRASKSNVPS